MSKNDIYNLRKEKINIFKSQLKKHLEFFFLRFSLASLNYSILPLFPYTFLFHLSQKIMITNNSFQGLNKLLNVK